MRWTAAWTPGKRQAPTVGKAERWPSMAIKPLSTVFAPLAPNPLARFVKVRAVRTFRWRALLYFDVLLSGDWEGPRWRRRSLGGASVMPSCVRLRGREAGWTDGWMKRGARVMWVRSGVVYTSGERGMEAVKWAPNGILTRPSWAMKTREKRAR